MENPLLALSLADLRQRRSLKWRLYGDDVLPLWVAEMDVLSPEPVVRAVSEAMAPRETPAIRGLPTTPRPWRGSRSGAGDGRPSPGTPASWPT